MADHINDGGPAYPSTEEHPAYDFPMHHFGMSLRDYFAAQALPVSIVDARNITAAGIDRLFGHTRTNISRAEIAAALSYETADAMIRARGAKPAREAA